MRCNFFSCGLSAVVNALNLKYSFRILLTFFSLSSDVRIIQGLFHLLYGEFSGLLSSESYGLGEKSESPQLSFAKFLIAEMNTFISCVFTMSTPSKL